MKCRLLLFLIFGAIVSVQGQTSNTSLYSRFGLGELHDGTSIKQRGMAGLTYGMTDPMVLNFKNPAALSFMMDPAFTLGLKHERVEAKNDIENQSNNISIFDHFALSFPIRQGMGGVSLGFVPYSIMGYRYSDSESIEGTDSETAVTYTGEGGLNTMFLKLGKKFVTKRDTSIHGLHDYFSIGAGLNYYFGSLTNSKRVEFPRNTGLINSFIADRTTYSNLGGDFGVLYKLHLARIVEPKDPLTVLNIGGTFQPGFELNGIKSDDVFTYLITSLGEQQVVDSISALRDQKGFAQLPSGFGFGMSLELQRQAKGRNTDLRRKFIFGVDYSANSWSDFQTNFLEVEDFTEITDNSNFVFGFSYLPNTGIGRTSTTNYFQEVTYRAGFKSSNLNLRFDNQQITETGINFGVSLPLAVGARGTRSNLDLSLGYGKRGTTENQLIQENYLRVMFGLSLRPDGIADKWFRKRKYD